MLVPDHEIISRVQWGNLLIRPFDEDLVQPASVDVRLSEWVRVPHPLAVGAGTVLDVADLLPDHTEVRRIPEEGWVLQPGAFLLGCTLEWVELPSDLTARVEGKSSVGRLGVTAHITAGFIDPGFRGQVTLEIANLMPMPVRLRRGMRIAQLAFTEMTSEPKRLYGQAGHYQGQRGPTESRYRLDGKDPYRLHAD